jgi:hypothetical protein
MWDPEHFPGADNVLNELGSDQLQKGLGEVLNEVIAGNFT